MTEWDDAQARGEAIAKAEKRAEQARIAEARGKRQEPPTPLISMNPEDPTAVPHAHMDEH